MAEPSKLKLKMHSVSDDDVRNKTSWKADGERCTQTEKIWHLMAGHSMSSGQQLVKHGYRRLIAWQMAPEDDWCL